MKDQTRTTLRMSIKIFSGSNLTQELLITTRQKTKLRNAFENNMLTDMKLSSGILGSLLSKLAVPSIKVAVPLAKTKNV